MVIDKHGDLDMRFRQRHLNDEQLSLLLDGRLSEKERRRVEAHLRSCPTCQQAYQGLRQTVMLLRAMPRVAAPRTFTLSEADVGRRLREARSIAWTRWATALVGLMLVMVLGLDVMTRVLMVGAPSVGKDVLHVQVESTAQVVVTLESAEMPAVKSVVSKAAQKTQVPTMAARAVVPSAVTPDFQLDTSSSPLPAPLVQQTVPTPMPTVPASPSETDALARPWPPRGILRLIEIGLAFLFVLLVILPRFRG